MKKVIVASQNPVKIETTRIGFGQMFPDSTFDFVGISAESGVSDQPMSDEETFQGALNRVANVKEMYPGADFYVGLEGGVEPDHENRILNEFAWIIVEDESGKVGKSRTATFIAPEAMYNLVVEKGLEVGYASDELFNKNNSKQKMGIVGLLTGGVIDRTEYYRHAVILALLPFTNKDLY